MAFMRNTGDFSPFEALIFTYWITILQMLKKGIPWEAIMNFSQSELHMVVGIEAALQQKEADDQARQMARSSSTSSMASSFPNMGGGFS